MPNFSPDRQAILDLLESMDRPMSPSEVAAMLSMEVEHVRKKLCLMKKADQVSITGRGLYQPVYELDPQDVRQNAFDLDE